MIPNFDTRGNLPPGIHIATINEVIDRYKLRNNLARAKRSEALSSFYDFICGFALDLYVNGSYITKKLAPSDVDLALVLPRDFDVLSFDGRRLQAMLNHPKNGDVHVFSYAGRDNPRLLEMVNFWRTDRNNNPKGIVLIRIN